MHIPILLAEFLPCNFPSETADWNMSLLECPPYGYHWKSSLTDLKILKQTIGNFGGYWWYRVTYNKVHPVIMRCWLRTPALTLLFMTLLFSGSADSIKDSWESYLCVSPPISPSFYTQSLKLVNFMSWFFFSFVDTFMEAVYVEENAQILSVQISGQTTFLLLWKVLLCSSLVSYFLSSEVTPLLTSSTIVYFDLF